MKIDKEGIKLMMLEVWMNQENGKMEWNFGDLPNCYFLLGALDVIKDELIQQINKESEENEN